MKIHFLAIPIVSSLLLGACSIPFVSQTIDKVTETAEQKAAEQEILRNCTYDKSICQYMAAQMGAFDSGLTMTSKMEFADKTEGQTTETTTAMDGQGNMQSISYRDGQETANMIVFNKATYMKDYEDGKWLKMTSGDSEESSPFDTAETLESIKEQFDPESVQMIFTKMGEEDCGQPAGGLTCEIYEMFEQGNELGKTKIWIDTKEHLGRKMEMILPDGSINTITYVYSSITITEPSPVKEFEMPNFNLGDTQAPTEEDLDKMMEDLPVDVPEM